MRFLFESFVAEWLRVNSPAGLTVRCKHNAYVDANFEMRISVDILLLDETTQSPVAVLDTKYKIADQPYELDIHQIGFYAHELGVRHALLVYPSPVSVPLRINHGKDVRLGSIVFNIGTSLNDAGESLSQIFDHSAGFLKLRVAEFGAVCFRGSRPAVTNWGWDL